MNINAVWIGPRLGPIHVACLRSFLAHGYRTVLHCYEKPNDVPQGVELADAAALLPREKVARHTEKGSLALTSDLMCYEILRRGLGLYVDCDVFCLRPIEDADYIFGWETGQAVNCAIFKLPPDCPALATLCRLSDETFIPPWASRREQRRYRWRARFGSPVSIEDMPWGYTGPIAVTWCLKREGLLKHARPIDAFYPVHWSQISLLCERGLTIDDVTTPRTELLHLYAQAMEDQSVARSRIPQDSPLGLVLRQ